MSTYNKIPSKNVDKAPSGDGSQLNAPDLDLSDDILLRRSMSRKKSKTTDHPRDECADWARAKDGENLDIRKQMQRGDALQNREENSSIIDSCCTDEIQTSSVRLDSTAPRPNEWRSSQTAAEIETRYSVTPSNQHRSLDLVSNVDNAASILSKEQDTGMNSTPNLSKQIIAPSGSTREALDDFSSDENDANPIIAELTNTPSNVYWSVHKQCLITRTVEGNKKDVAPRIKVAAFDLDQTLVLWRCSGWPNRPEHYELWSSSVITKLQGLHDDGFKLVLFSNQGGIRGAFQGKNATRVKGIIDWIATLIKRPLFAVCSTKKDSGYRMWTVMEEVCNGCVEAKPELSFFVGDADGSRTAVDPTQLQYQMEGVDKLFAQNVGKLRNVDMSFYTPDSYFGRSNAERRKSITAINTLPALPAEAMATRAALFGGYLSTPILLLLVGVQGSGKSTFSQSLVDGCSSWCHYSQDTVANGRPGKREAVEAAALSSLREGKNVVVDRMHLDPEQRAPFVELANQCAAPVHALVLIASKDEVFERVKSRENHPGKVQGERGAKMAVSSLENLKLPSYDEGFALISYSHEIDGAFLATYRYASADDNRCRRIASSMRLLNLYNSGSMDYPMITLGTMGINKKSLSTVLSQAFQVGIKAVDTAPTYNNERQIGLAINSSTKVVVKVPKRVISASEARDEVTLSLSKLGRHCADLILLHWPSDLIEGGTLPSVWKELETMKKEGLCLGLGVSNFSISSLCQLLLYCEIKPSINQVERHPLLPQYDLIEYCQSQAIVVQAHSPLGNGNSRLLKHTTILKVASDSGLTPGQVLLLWNLQQSVPIVTKFTSEQHSQEIVPILKSEVSLSHQQMKHLDEIYLSSGDSARFVAPPFMYRPGASYSWGDKPP